jgi:hypothetical protein
MEELFNLDGSSLALMDPDFELLDTEDGLGALGARKKRKGRKKRKVKASTRKKLKKAAKKRKRKKTGQFAGLGKTKKKRKKRKKSRAKAKKRGGKRRKKRAAPVSSLMSLVALSGLGKTKRKKRKKGKAKAKRKKGRKVRKVKASTKRKLKKAAKKRKRRKRTTRKGRAGTFMGLGRLAKFSDSIGMSEVKSSMPVIGAFEWLATGPGLQAFGGVAVAPIVHCLVKDGLMVKLLKQKADNAFVQVGSGLLSAIAMWEIGRAIGSANFSKFGAFYSLGRTLEDMLTTKQIIERIQTAIGTKAAEGMGQLRIPDTEQLVGMGQLRVPESQELGIVRIPEEQELSQEIVTEEELLGQFPEEEGEEESEVF